MNAAVKITVTIMTALMIFSCHPTDNKNVQNLYEEVENFDWLLGHWKRINEAGEKETFEIWEKLDERNYMGVGFTLLNADTISQEKMQISEQDGKWELTVKVPEESEVTVFPIIEEKNGGFTCANDFIDFPKQIKYWRNGDRINALVAGDSLKIEFEFERIEQ